MRLYIGKQDHNIKNRKHDNPIVNALKRKLKRCVVYGCKQIGDCDIGELCIIVYKRNNKTVDRIIPVSWCIEGSIDNYQKGLLYCMVGTYWLETGNSTGL